MAKQNTGVQTTSKDIKTLLNSQDVQNRFAEILGRNSKAFITSVISAVQTTPKLKEAEPNSVMMAAAMAATLNLPINPNLGHAYIIPYKTKQPDGTYATKAQFQIGWKGFVQLAQRSGQMKKIAAAPVYEGQIKSYNKLTGVVFDFSLPENGKPIGYAAYFELHNGFEKTLYMTREEITAHGKKYSKSFSSGVWKTDFDGMAMKTVTKLLLTKYAPLSIEGSDLAKALEADQSEVTEDGQFSYVDNPKIPEKNTLDHEKVSGRKQRERLMAHISNSDDLTNLSMVEDLVKDDPELEKLYADKKSELEIA